jgi:hypothetical protein
MKKLIGMLVLALVGCSSQPVVHTAVVSGSSHGSFFSRHQSGSVESHNSGSSAGSFYFAPKGEQLPPPLHKPTSHGGEN